MFWMSWMFWKSAHLQIILFLQNFQLRLKITAFGDDFRYGIALPHP